MNVGISMSATPGLTDFAAVAQKIEELGFDSGTEIIEGVRLRPTALSQYR